MTKNVAILLDNTAHEARGLQLAHELKLPIVYTPSTCYDYYVIITPTFIGIKKNNSREKSFYIDFLAKKLQYRLTHTTLKKEALVRALGLKKNAKDIIWDGTAGLGRDSFMLAHFGFNVMLFERSPLVYLLLQDGLLRAQTDKKMAAVITRMQLHKENILDAMHNTKVRPDLIYLDPMFPTREKSSLHQKEMRILHDLIGSDADADDLLLAALACAQKRVVVKRPRKANSLANMPPSFSITGSSSRFDVYLT